MKSFVVVLVGRVLQMLLAFVALRAMSSLLGAEQLGRLSLINAIVAFFALILVNPTGMYINRRLHAWADGGVLFSRLVRFFFFLLGVAALASVTVPIVQLAFGHPWPIDNAWLISLVAGYLLITTLNQTIIPSLNILGHRISWLIFSTLTLVAALAISLLLARRTPSAEFWQTGQLAGYLVGLVIAVPIFLRFVRSNRRSDFVELAEKDTLSSILSFTLPLSISVSLNWVQFQSYRLVISQWIGLEALGKFVGVYTLVAGLMAAFENLIQQYFYPQLYAKSSSANPADRSEAWRQFASISLPTTLIGGLTLLAAGRPLVRLMLAPAFQDAHRFILIAVIAETSRVCANVYGMAGQIAMKTHALLIPQIASAVALAILIPVCFLVLTSTNDISFLISLGLPALLLIGLSALFAQRRLAVSVPLRAFVPAVFAAIFATMIYLFNLQTFDHSLTATIVQLIFVGAIFSSLMLWTVLRWRNAWAAVPAVGANP